MLHKLTILLAAAAVIAASAAIAAPAAQGGPYRVEITTEPAVIPVGRATLHLRVTEASAKPVEGAEVRVLAQMPSMPMGEKETLAHPDAGAAGRYTAPAVFGMAGEYSATVRIAGPAGAATIVVLLSTGENTLEAGGGLSAMTMTLVFIALAFCLFVAYRMKRAGMRIEAHSVLNRQALTGGVMLAVMLFCSMYAVNHWRRSGAMTPIEAQAMEMNNPAPPSAAAVTLGSVDRGEVQATVRYTGQAVGYNEQDVYARAQGWMSWMPFYAGDRVKAGQLLARLDTSQIAPQIQERQGGLDMARQGVGIARAEYEMALADAHRAHGEQGTLAGAVREAEANVQAARDEESSAEADLAAAQSRIPDSQAQIDATRAEQKYWQAEIARERDLLAKGAVSAEEYQRELSQAAAADSKVVQAEAGLVVAQAQVRSAQSTLRKATSMVNAASGKLDSTRADLASHTAHVAGASAAIDAARERIAAARSGVVQAQGSLGSATTALGYAEVRSPIDGIVTQRLISPGALVNPGQSILKITQVSPIRLQANVAQQDLLRVRVGSRVMVRSQADDDQTVEARITSVSPAVDPAARTGTVEAVVPNEKHRFLPGQYIVMDIVTGGSMSALRIPSAAVRSRSEAGGIIAGAADSYVWTADSVQGTVGQYTVHAVRVELGAVGGGYTQILSGIGDRQQVVLQGADYLKEGDTVTSSQSATPGAPSAPAPGETPSTPAEKPAMAEIPGISSSVPHSHGAGQSAGANAAIVEISVKGFSPPSISLKAGVRARITFIRRDDQTCAKEIVIPEYGIRRPLPLGQPVVVELTPRRGEMAFTCGMNMLSGKVVAR